MKRFTALMLALIILFTLTSCKNGLGLNDTSLTEENESAAQPGQSDVIKIGVFEKQSGDYAAGAKQSILGLKYANEVLPEIEIGDKKYAVKLDIAEFSVSDESIRQAAQKLADDGVSVVIGSFDNDNLSGVADIFENAGIPVICPYGCPVKISDNFENVFSFTEDDYEAAQKSASFAFEQLMARKVLIIPKLGDDSSQSQALFFKEAFESLGGGAKIITFEDEIDFASDISSYDLIYAPVSQCYAPYIIYECEAANANVPILGGRSWDSAATLSEIENLTFPVYAYSHCNINRSTQFAGEFSAWISNDKDLEYMNAGSSIVSAASVLSYDAYMLFVTSVINAGSAEMQDIISQIKKIEYTGETGKIAFDENSRNKFRTSALKKFDLSFGTFI